MKIGVQTYSFLACSPATPGEEKHHGPRHPILPQSGVPRQRTNRAGQHSHPFLCTQCHKTFSATTGTALYRLRTSAETVSLVVTLLAHGCPLQAIVVAFGFDVPRLCLAAKNARLEPGAPREELRLDELSRDVLRQQSRCKPAVGSTNAPDFAPLAGVLAAALGLAAARRRKRD